MEIGMSEMGFMVTNLTEMSLIEIGLRKIGVERGWIEIGLIRLICTALAVPGGSRHRCTAPTDGE